jgi:hypothetical protein
MMTDAHAGSHPRVLAAAVFVALLLLYHLNGDFLPGHDAVPNTHLALQLVHHGRLTFTPDDAPLLFRWELESKGRWQEGRLDRMDDAVQALRRAGRLRLLAPDYYLVPSVDPERLGYVNIYGPVAGLVALPMVALYALGGHDLEQDRAALWFGAKLTAAVCVALSAAVLFLALLRFVRETDALVATLAYGVGTCVWSVSSQALWQSTPALLLLTLAAYWSLDAERSARAAAACGVAAALAAACRPTGVLVLAAIGVHLAAAAAFGPRREPARTAVRPAMAYAIAAALVLMLFAWHNWHYLGSPLTFGQVEAGRRVAATKLGIADPWGGSLAEGLLGQLVSPARGLFVYSPILLFALWGACSLWRDPRLRALRPLAAGAALVVLLQSKWIDWHGGHSFGYRVLVDVTPLLVLCSVPIVARVRERPALRASFFVALAWSIAVQVIGAYAYDVTGWNSRIGYRVSRPTDAAPTLLLDRAVAVRLAEEAGTRMEVVSMDVDQRPFRERLWSIRDNPLAFYAARFGESRRRKKAMIAAWLRFYAIADDREAPTVASGPAA